MKEILLLDQDGVLANYETAFLDRWRNAHPDKIWIPIEERATHNVDEQYPKELKGLINEIMNSPGFYRNFPPIEGAIDAVKELAEYYDVFICTSPAKKYHNCILEKFQWIEEHFGHEWTQRIILTRDKTLVKGKYLVDDKPNIHGINVPSWEQVLYRWNYNRNLPKRSLRWDDNSWREILLK